MIALCHVYDKIDDRGGGGIIFIRIRSCYIGVDASFIYCDHVDVSCRMGKLLIVHVHLYIYRQCIDDKFNLHVYKDMIEQELTDLNLKSNDYNTLLSLR